MLQVKGQGESDDPARFALARFVEHVLQEKGLGRFRNESDLATAGAFYCSR